MQPDLGVVLLPGKVRGLEKYPIVPRFRERFHLPVRAQNDGTLSIYAEKYAGQAKQVNWAVTLTLRTGVGSGVMLDGRILDDPRFMFGTQVGHLVINTANDQLCLTGARGTAEMLCSTTALALAVRGGLHAAFPRRSPTVILPTPMPLIFARSLRTASPKATGFAVMNCAAGPAIWAGCWLISCTPIRRK